MSGLLQGVDLHSLHVPDLLAKLLQASRSPATIVLGRAAGTTLHIQVAGAGERGLTLSEAGELDAAEGEPCRWRTGKLVTEDGRAAAGTFLLWLPSRLDPATCAALDAGKEPAGVILGRLGMRREWRRALAVNVIDEVTGEDAAVTSKAVLVVGGQAAGIAEERILWAFTESLAQ